MKQFALINDAIHFLTNWNCSIKPFGMRLARQFGHIVRANQNMDYYNMDAKNIGLLLVKPFYTVHDYGDSVFIEFDDGDNGRMVLTEMDGSPTVKREDCNKFCFHSQEQFDEFVRRVNEMLF